MILRHRLVVVEQRGACVGDSVSSMPARRASTRAGVVMILLAGAIATAAHAITDETAANTLRAAFQSQVDRQLVIPDEESARYGALTRKALADGGIAVTQAQFVLVIDRSPAVQAVFVYWLAPEPEALVRLIGASPASTGRVGQFDYFETPVGVFDHTVANPDFRAEGTRNELGVRGYGIKGMRVFDLGWQQALRGWGSGGISEMRLQIHATDPDLLEQRLGSVQSKGCVRIPATLNRLLDTYGVLDADYFDAEVEGRRFWVLAPDRLPLGDAGRYVVILDTGRAERPAWSPAPRAVVRSGAITKDRRTAKQPAQKAPLSAKLAGTSS